GRWFIGLRDLNEVAYVINAARRNGLASLENLIAEILDAREFWLLFKAEGSLAAINDFHDLLARAGHSEALQELENATRKNLEHFAHLFCDADADHFRQCVKRNAAGDNVLAIIKSEPWRQGQSLTHPSSAS